MKRLLLGLFLALAALPATAQTVNTYITPTVTATAVASLVLKASAGLVYSAYATNNTSTAGFFVLLNAISDPTSGTVKPLACAALPANGTASINYIPTPPALFNVGITAVMTSASSCYTITEGTITGFIGGTVK
jgi:hypothetical protein